jgi:hypothetical protein
MIPLWKLKREIRRLGLQAGGLVDTALGRGRRNLYDRRWPRNVTVTQGADAPAAHMAILLLYQPKGLSGSVQLALDALRASGAVLVVVSNLPLTAADRATLARQSWRVVERPNLGYDFGGFREGVRQIQAAGLALEELWIVNDSAWFPVCASADQAQSDPLRALIDPAADLSGSMIRYDKRNRAKKNIESYFLTFRKTALDHPAFAAFWQNYPLLKNKQAVIRRGEIELTRVLVAAGLTADSKMSNDAFLAALTAQSAEFLRKTLLYEGLNRPAMLAQRKALLEIADGTDLWRDKALAHVAQTLGFTEFRYQYCYAAVHLMGFPFVKKGSDPRAVISRACYLDAVRAGDLPPLPTPMMTELTAAVTTDFAMGHEWRMP